MKLRFTLSTDEQTVNGNVIAADSQEISEPGEFNNCVIKLERHPEFHSLIESFDTDLIFYGANGEVDGGINFIREKESQLGPDAAIKIKIEIAFDDINYETVFTGLLDLAGKEELWDNTMSVPVIRDDLWSKFISRLEVPVNIQDPVDLDGNPVNVFDAINISLLPQKLRANTRILQDIPQQIFVEDDEAEYPYIQFDLWDVELSEITEKFNLPSAFNQERPAGLLIMEYAGVYVFDIKLCLTVQFSDPDTDDPAFHDLNGAWQITLYFQINDEAKQAFTQVDKSATPVGLLTNVDWSEFTYQDTHTLNAGDTIRVYAEVTQILFGNPNAYLILLGSESGDLIWDQLTPAQPDIPFPEFDQIDSHIFINGNTEFHATNAEGFLLHDVFAAIIERITGQSGIFYSEHLGSPFTKYRQYPRSGCAWFYALLKGLHIRGYSILEKSFFLPCNDTWDGANPILNLGLGYDIVDPSQDPEPTVAAFNEEQQLGTGEDWQLLLGPTRYEVEPPAFGSSKLLAFEIFGGVEGAAYNIGYDLTLNTTLGTRIALWDAALVQTVSVLQILPSGNHQGTVSLTPNFIPKYLTFRNGSLGGGGATWTVLPFTFDVVMPSSNPIQVLRIEEKEHWYDASQTSADFSHVQNIVKVYDREQQFNQIEIGYQKWNAEDVSGLDDPQTKRTYSTIFKRIGQKLTLFSKFIAAGLTIEVTRRTTREKSADYKYDNDTFIIAIDPEPIEIDPETSPDLVDFQPELDENFTSVDNLENPDSRYNLRLTPARNLLRWINYISGCVQFYFTSVFKFVSGEGNYDMSSTMADSSPDCGDRADNVGEELSEKQDIPISSDYLFIPEPIQITDMPMEWEEYKTIRDNPKNPIGISQTGEDHVKCFIRTLEYKVLEGTCDIVAWPKVRFEIQVVETVPAMDCNPSQEDQPLDDDCFIELETGEPMLTETNSFMELETC